MDFVRPKTLNIKRKTKKLSTKRFIYQILINGTEMRAKEGKRGKYDYE